MRRRRRSQHHAVFERELDKSLEAHEHPVEQWDRGITPATSAARPYLVLISHSFGVFAVCGLCFKTTTGMATLSK